MFLIGENVFHRKTLFVALKKVVQNKQGQTSYGMFFNHINLFYIQKKIFNFTKKILNYINFFELHYSQFTPGLRFIYCLKQFFAYCFNKAPTLYFGLYINSPPDTVKSLIGLTQGLKNVALALFCCLYKLKGGVIC